MINEDLINELPAGISYKNDVSLAAYSSFKVGGACPLFINCPTSKLLIETIRILDKYSTKFIIIGEGTNILVSDNGVDEVVIRFCSDNQKIKVNDLSLVVAAQTNLDKLVQHAIRSNLGDITFLSGIPGTVGGAIVGNAGAFGKQIGDVLNSAEVITDRGIIKTLSKEEFNFTYRSSSLKNSSIYLLSATLSLDYMDCCQMKKSRDEIISLRKEKHPDWKTEPCAGSIFRNIEPTSAADKRQAAGWFLEESGVKDFKEGGAYVYEKHANIIIASKSSTANDVYILSEKMKNAVKDKFNIDLIREIKLLGSY